MDADIGVEKLMYDWLTPSKYLACISNAQFMRRISLICQSSNASHTTWVWPREGRTWLSHLFCPNLLETYTGVDMYTVEFYAEGEDTRISGW